MPVSAHFLNPTRILNQVMKFPEWHSTTKLIQKINMEKDFSTQLTCLKKLNNLGSNVFSQAIRFLEILHDKNVW